MSNTDEEKCGECDEPLLSRDLKCRYDDPIPYKHPKGAVIWVKL